MTNKKTKTTSIIAITFFAALMLILPTGMNAFAASPILSTDFSNSTGWNQVGTLNEISNGVLNWNADSQNVEDTLYYLLPETVSQGTLKFKINIDAVGGGDYTNLFFFGLSDGSLSPYDCNANNSFVGFEVKKRGQTPVSSDFRIVDSAVGGTNWDDCPPYNTPDDDSLDYSTDDYWVRLDFDSLIYSVTIYSDEWITIFDTMTGTKTSESYTYLVAQTYKRGNIGNTINGHIDDVVLFDTLAPSEPNVTELQLQIDVLTNTVTSLNATVTSLNSTINQQQQDIDYLYTIWEQVRDTIINWLAVRP